MKYVPKNFTNGQSPPINAQALNDIEKALVDLSLTSITNGVYTSDSSSVIYDIQFEGYETMPSEDELPLMVAFTPTVTNDDGLFIQTNWQDDQYPVFDLSTNTVVKSDVIKAGQPTILLFDGVRFWVQGNGNYLKYGIVSNADGYWDHSNTNPTGTKRLNYSGCLHATELHGAVYNNTSADVAEGYPVHGNCKAGDLVCVDKNGKYYLNEIEFNTNVIGFCSNEYAALFGTDYGKTPIAITGRLHVKLAGSCKPGAYLSGCEIPGAVRSVNLNDAPRGSVVAMALEEAKSDNANDINYVLAQLVRL